LLATPLILPTVPASVPLLFIGSGVFGIALAVVNILIQTSLQESIPNAVLSRVTSIYSLAALGLGPIRFPMPETMLAVGAGGAPDQCGPRSHVIQCSALWPAPNRDFNRRFATRSFGSPSRQSWPHHLDDPALHPAMAGEGSAGARSRLLPD
jgi:MFS family permease